jgi:hypothetical protein
MKAKLVQIIPAVIALLAIGFNYFSIWCIFTNRACYGTTIDHIGLSITQPAYFFALYFLIAAIIAIFIPRPVFNSWVNFSIWAVVLAIIFMATQPVYSTQIIFATDRDSAARLSGQIFAGISLILIIWKSIAARRKSVKV